MTDRPIVSRAWAWRALVVGGVVVAVAYLFLPPAGRVAAFVAVPLVAVVATVATARTRTHRRLGWWVLAAAVGGLAAGDALFLLGGPYGVLRPAQPGDVPYLLGTAALAVALFALGRQPGRNAGSESAIDVALLSVAGAAVVWSLVGEAALAGSEPGLGQVVVLLYPLLDLVLLATAASLLLAPRRWTAPVVLLVVAGSAQLLADFLFGLDRGVGLYGDGGIPDVLWLLVYVAAAGAATHPASSHVGERPTEHERGISHWRVLVLWAAFLGSTVASVALVAPTVGDDPVRAFAQLAVVVTATAVMASLVLFRLSRTAGRLRSALEQRHELHQRLTHEASHDPLTGLANRRRFLNAVRAATSLGHEVTVCYFDLDHFKEVNDRHGHKAGDELLRIIGARLDRILRGADLAARLGGDEFAVLLEDTSSSQVQTIAERIADDVAAPVALDQDTTVHIGVSIGIARSSHDDPLDRDLLHDADVAMYASKRDGRSRISWYSEEVSVAEVARLALQDDVREAVRRDELRLVYQPIVTVPDRVPVAVEALLRWHQPDRDPVTVTELVTVAEDVGAIVPIGSWVLRQACQQAAAWGADGLELRVNVNVSPVQLVWPGFADDVEEALASADLDASRLVLEITETALLEDALVVRPTIERLRRLGVRFSVDDFGTGYSSLRYLRDVPLDELKIDRTFVAGIADGPEDAALALAVIHLAASFDLRTVAEGVERDAQVVELASRGCGLAQGYLFSPPLGAVELATWARRNTPRRPTGDERAGDGSPVVEAAAHGSEPAGRR